MISLTSLRIKLFVVITFTALFLFSPLHEFLLWDQVVTIRGIELKFIDLFSQAHFLRYLLVLPIYLMSDLANIDANILFNTISFFNLSLITLNCIFISQFYIKKNYTLVTIFFTILLILVSSFMNGRIIFSLLGYSYLLLSVHRWESFIISNSRFMINTLISLFLCSVSTGTFLSCIIFLVSWMLIYSNYRKKGVINIFFTLFLILLSPVIYLYTLKNILFYGGGFSGFINMFQHGLGQIFHMIEYDTLVLLLFETVILSAVFIVMYLNMKDARLLLLILLTSFISGLFGYSTLSLTLIPISLVIIIFLVKSLSHLLPKHNYK